MMEDVEAVEPFPPIAAARWKTLRTSLPTILWNIGVLIAVLVLWQLLTVAIASRFFRGRSLSCNHSWIWPKTATPAAARCGSIPGRASIACSPAFRSRSLPAFH